MATYLQRDAEGNMHPVPFAKPTPAHALTPAAESARQSVRDHAERQRGRLTREDVERAYVHPEPEEPAHEIDVREVKSVLAERLIKAALAGSHRVKATRNRGTTVPKWWVNAPDSRPNPGPPVAADQYHGTLVTVETVYIQVVTRRSRLNTVDRVTHRIKGVWQNGRIDRVEVDGVETTLDAALVVLS